MTHLRSNILKAPLFRPAILGALLCVLAFASVAHATAFYWYGESADCWQTGTPGAPSHGCDYPGGGTIHEAITGDLNTTQSGDYCNTYNTPATCVNQDAEWPLSFTAEEEPCPARSKTYGEACGAQHYVSLGQQEDLPWSSGWFGQSAALVVSAELAIKITKPASSWAYLCPVLKAPEPAGTNYYLEICFDEWQGSQTQESLPEPPFASRGYGLNTICAPVTVKGSPSAVDQLVVPFALGESTPYGTTLSGSANTGVGEGTANELFKVEITPEDLRNAIKRDNQAKNPERNHEGSPEYHNSGNKYGCDRGLSEELSGYRLVGIQDGVEGYPNTRINANTTNLKAWTEYTTSPPPTESEGTPPTWVAYNSETSAAKVLHPNSEKALALWEWNNGPGWTHSTLGGSLASESMPTVQYEQGSSQVNVYYPEAKGAVVFRQWLSGSGWSGEEVLGGQVAPATSVTVTRRPTDGQTTVYYENSQNELAYWQWNPNQGWGWADTVVGGKMASGTSPTVTYNPENSQATVYYRNSAGELATWQWNNGSGWASAVVGGKIAADTSLTVTRRTSDGQTTVYFQNANAELAMWQWNSGKGWTYEAIGGHLMSSSGLAVTRRPSDGQTTVYYETASGELAYWQWNPNQGWGWTDTVEGNHMHAGSALAVTRRPGDGQTTVYYLNSNSELAYSQWNVNGGWTNVGVGAF